MEILTNKKNFMGLTFTSLKKTGLHRVLLVLLLASGLWQGVSAQCTWTTSVPITVPYLDAPVVAVGTNLYVFGGVSNNAIVATSYKFDGTAWTAIAPLPQALEFASAVTDGTNIYIFGGANSVGTPVRALYRYNIATNTYTTLASAATGTWNQAGVFLNGKIYKIAGTATGSSSVVEIYTIGTDTWAAGAAYPQPMSFVSAATDGNFIYGAGGFNGIAASNKTYRYDPGTNTWNDAAIADLPASRWGAAGAFYSGRFILAGGYVGGSVTTNISASTISYQPVLDTWATEADMPGERARTNGAVLGNNFHVIGGRSQASAGFIGTNSNFRLNCAPIVCVPTAATAPVIGGPSSTCAGSSVTLTILAGSLNGAAQWRWYTGSCGGTLVGTGTSITVSPAATTTYFVRGEGGCAPAAGPCATRTVTVTNCSCITPDAATICAGAIQRLAVTLPPGTVQSFTSTGAISIPSVGIATPYPSTVTVAGVAAGAKVKSVRLNGLSHTWPSDIDMVLVGPDGTTRVVLMSDVGGTAGINGFVYTFDDSAPTLMPVGSAPQGTYRPTNAGATDNYPAPGPGSVTQATPSLSTFGTGDLNGTWRLYIVDDTGGDLGSLASFTITFERPFPTAIWTGGTFFTDAAATVPYVAGSQAYEVWVRPTATTTYTATIAAGPCAGANNVTVTVLTTPTVTLTPASACGPVKLRAGGADFYAFSPSLGLTAVGGDSAIANPIVTTTYTVTGTTLNGCQSTATATVNSAPTASVIAAVAGATFQINEGFETVLPSGWSRVNNSTPPLGATQWVQGNAAALFPAFNGTPNSYATTNFNATTGTAGNETLSTWMISPVVNIRNGDQVSFYTRTVAAPAFPDRLQVRLSTAGNSTNVGTTPTSVGDFTTILVEVNPALTTSGYPNAWTRFTGTVSGLAAPTTGRIAFRYFVTNGGPNGANSDNIGVDQVEYSTPAGFNCANVVTNLAVNITGGVGPYTVVFSNGTTNTTIPNYTSGSNIQVSPAATTTYTIVSVTGSNGCLGTNNTGSATITITPPASITTQPVASNTCIGNNATFTVVTGPSTGNVIQWQVSSDSGRTYTNIVNAPPYSGATTGTLTVTGVTAAQNGLRFRAIIQGVCGAAVTTNGVYLNANAPAVITTQPALTTRICANGSSNASATVTVAATGTALTYQYQLSTDGGVTWTNVANGGNYAGATSNTLTLNNVPATFSGYLYRVLVSSGGCTATRSDSTRLIVNAAPVIVTTASPSATIIPGQTSTLSVAVSPNAGASYQWFLNGVLIPGATASTYVANVDGFGSYTVRVTDVNGCIRTSAAFEISAGTSENLFIYPSPNTGQFQVRYNDPNGFNSTTSRVVNIYDSKGSRVYSRVYPINQPFERLDVDLRHHGKGIYTVDLTDRQGRRLKTGRVVIF